MNHYVEALNSMGETGNSAIDTIFMICVILLADLAALLGLSYEALNIIIFVIIMPTIIIAQAIYIVNLKRKQVK